MLTQSVNIPLQQQKEPAAKIDHCQMISAMPNSRMTDAAATATAATFINTNTSTLSTPVTAQPTSCNVFDIIELALPATAAPPSRSVRFHLVHVHVYPVVLGCPPSMPIIGAPIQLGWDRINTYSVPVDAYESEHRYNHATEFKTLRISSSIREAWLKKAGHSAVQIDHLRRMASGEFSASTFKEENRLMDWVWEMERIRTVKSRERQQKKLDKKQRRNRKANRSLSPFRRRDKTAAPSTANANRPPPTDITSTSMDAQQELPLSNPPSRRADHPRLQRQQGARSLSPPRGRLGNWVGKCC